MNDESDQNHLLDQFILHPCEFLMELVRLEDSANPTSNPAAAQQWGEVTWNNRAGRGLRVPCYAAIVDATPQSCGHVLLPIGGRITCYPLKAMNLTLEQFVGCMVGLATGDALGAPYEGGPIERFVWRLLGKTSDGRMRWTDDTQMTLDLAASLLTDCGVCQNALASRFASSYRWSRGYGPGTAKVLKQIRRGAAWQTASNAVYPEGSYGNGAAMRAPVLALFFTNDEELLLQSARESSVVTHSHPIGIDAATMIAMATSFILHRVDPRELFARLIAIASTSEIRDRLALAASWIDSNARPAAREVASRLGNGISAQTSCPTAVYIALRHLNETFEKMIAFTIECRGDVDTIGAMAGALWGASAGSSKLPAIMLESRDEIAGIATQLFNRYQHRADNSAVNGSRR